MMWNWDAGIAVRLGATGVLAMAAVAPLDAQSAIVIPPSYAGVEGTGSTNVPLGRLGPMRVQMAYDSVLFAQPVVVSGLGVRPDGGVPVTAKTVDVEVRLSTSPWGVANLRATFALNRGADEVVAFGRKTLQLPAVAAPGTPSPFALRFPLDRSFSYDPAGGPLLVEMIVHGQPPGAYSLDATYLCSSPFQAFGPAGCGAGGSPLEVRVPTAQVLWGRSLQVEVRRAPPGAVTGLAFGSMESGVWNGVPIPLNLSPFGAPQCHISTDLLVILPGTADASGVASYPLSVPAVPSLQNEWLRFQGLALAPAANSLGVVFSQAGKVQVCGWEPVARVYAASASAAWGFREVGVAPVLEITE